MDDGVAEPMTRCIHGCIHLHLKPLKSELILFNDFNLVIFNKNLFISIEITYTSFKGTFT